MVIPGVQGRWEWMLPALRALAKRCRTISYSLPPVVDFEQFVVTQLVTVSTAAWLKVPPVSVMVSLTAKPLVPPAATVAEAAPSG